MKDRHLIVTQIRSCIGRVNSHKSCLRGLGIRRLHQSVRILSTPENLGMIAKISYMLKVKDA